MRILYGAVLAAALTSCATAPQYPSMRPLTQAHIDQMSATPVVISESNNGVEKAWFFTSTQAAGAAYGLVGALVSAAMDAIINAGPSRRAQKAADEIAELMPVEALNESLLEQFRLQMPGAQQPQAATLIEATQTPADPSATAEPIAVAEPAPPPPPAPPVGVYYDNVSSVQRLATASTPVENAILVTTGYTLSEDSSTLRIVACASYQSPETPYTTPYAFERAPPRAEREGPAYRNCYTYYSQQLEVPTLTPELRERLVASIQDSARDEAGALPVEGSDGYRSMERELENARDDRLTKDEIAIFLTRNWLRDDGAMLKREIEQAHSFIARYVLLDMNRTAIPSLAGQDELIETMPDQRTVRRIGTGTQAGSYVSSAANVTSFSTYGNAIGIARRHRERMSAIRDEARDTRAARR